MTTEMTEKIYEYIDKFIASDLVLIKIKEENYPINSLRRIFLQRIKERKIENVTSYTFLSELYLEKI